MNIWRTIPMQREWESEYDAIKRHRAVLKARKGERAFWKVGQLVKPMTAFNLVESDGTRMYAGEVGTITRVTRSTIDVLGPHGLMKSRPRYHFKPAEAGAA